MIEFNFLLFFNISVTSGSFVYDVSLSLDSWKPSPSELRVLSADMVKLASQEIPLERLQVHEDIAKAIFRNNKFKLAQIPNIASGSGKFAISKMAC